MVCSGACTDWGLQTASQTPKIAGQLPSLLSFSLLFSSALPPPSSLSSPTLLASVPARECEVWREFIVWLLHAILPQRVSFGFPLASWQIYVTKKSPWSLRGWVGISVPYPVFVLAGSPVPLTPEKGSRVFLTCHDSCLTVSHQVPGSAPEPQLPGKKRKNSHPWVCTESTEKVEGGRSSSNYVHSACVCRTEAPQIWGHSICPLRPQKR